MSVSVPAVMACEDRTGDFAQLVAEERKRLTKLGDSTLPSSTRRVGRRSKFHELASNIALELASTYDKLGRLTELAKSSNMSFDPAEKIEEMSGLIKEDMSRLRGQLTILQDLQDTQNRQVGEHSRTVLKALSLRLQMAKQKFTTILEKRKANLKRAFEKKKLLFGNAGGSLNRRKVDNPLYSTTRMTSEERSATTDVAITMPQMSLQLEQQEESRAHAVETIQRTILELGQIFDQVNLLVAQQGELVERIDSNVSDMSRNVDVAKSALEQHWESITSSKWLYFKLGLIGAAFVVVFVVFFV